MTLSLFGDRASGAWFSDCRRYRYSLWRTWGAESNLCVFVGLNPSTADETVDDPTIRRCIAFAKRWGFGSYYMLNLFAWRSTDPDVLPSVDDPIGIRNNDAIAGFVSRAARVVMAWGSHKKIRPLLGPRETYVRNLIVGMAACAVGHLGLNDDGSPKHPLYLPKSTPFVAMEIP